MKTGTGLYRVHGTDGRPDDVRIDLVGITAPLEESLPHPQNWTVTFGDGDFV